MPTLTPSPETLPQSIAERLTPEQLQAISEASRGQRLAQLAAGLELGDAEALATLAAACGLTVASNLETDPGARGLFPARLVHDYQIIPILLAPPANDGTPDEQSPQAALHLATAWPPDETMIDWMRTFTSRPLVWHLAVPERVQQLIIENFGVGSGSLAQRAISCASGTSVGSEDTGGAAARARRLASLASAAAARSAAASSRRRCSTRGSLRGKGP